MTYASLEQLLEPGPASWLVPPRLSWVAALRAAVASAKPWQAVLVDWAGGAPLVIGDPISRHWTRWGARRAADWSSLRVLPAGMFGMLRYVALPTRHPLTV